MTKEGSAISGGAGRHGSVVLTEHGSRTEILLSSPTRRNAIDIPMREDLIEALTYVATSKRCRGIVLRGDAGTFCAGGDLSGMTAEPETFRRRISGMAEIIRRMVDLPVPSVAAVQGYALGAGLSLALGADYIVASDDAVLGCSFGDVGLTGDTGIHWTLPQRVGHARARMLLMSGRRLTAPLAHGMGLVDEAVAPRDCVAAARERCEELAARAPLAIRATKRILADHMDSLDSVLAIERAEQHKLMASGDFLRARDAFLAKRDREEFEGS